MKRFLQIIAAILCLLPIFCFAEGRYDRLSAIYAMVSPTSPTSPGGAEQAAGGYSCDGAQSWSGGVPEDFEASAGNFCTDGATETDNSSAINTNDSTESFCNSNSISVISDSDGHGNDDYVTFDIGSTESTAYFRLVWVNTPTFNGNDNNFYWELTRPGDATPDKNAGSELVMKCSTDGGGTCNVYSDYNWGGGQCTWDNLTGETIMWLIKYVNVGPSEVIAYKWSGSAWAVEPPNDDPDVCDDLTMTTEEYSIRYLHLNSSSAYTTTTTHYYDVVEYCGTSAHCGTSNICSGW